MQRAVVVVVLLALVAAAGAFFVIRRNGLAADRPPGRIETALARRLVTLSIPAASRGMPNPYAHDPAAWRAAIDHFEEHCAMCHGSDGRGRSPIASKMYPPVPDLASPAIQQLSDGALFSIIQHGVRWTGMPAFRAEHSADETWKLVSFVRQVPRLTPKDLERERDHTEAHQHDGRTISMDGTAFVPPELHVKVGDTVVWINKDPFPHDISSKPGGFHSGNVEPDAQWQFRAAKPGTFPYVCTLHPGMKGTLIVNQ